ncbi:cytochrome P450 6a22-like [Musca autumnalis]|uniref:cytochrome P450 6a22-like n=1 Tax=Musca autumnalis TaxID=221902 RepID=UPI003CFB2D18
MSGNNIRPISTIKDENGQELSNPDEQIDRWRRFFSTENPTDNETQPNTSTSTLRRNPRRDVNTDPPTYEEVLRALKSLKNGKAAGPDNIPSELLKGFNNPNDPLSTNLIRLDYKWWHPLRQKLSPVFSPAKMRAIFPTLYKMCELLTSKLEIAAKEAKHNHISIHDLCARYTTDVIGNVAFGIAFNSLEHPNSQVRQQALKLFDYSWHPILDSLMGHYSWLGNFFNIKIFKPDLSNFFVKLVSDIIDYREKSGKRQSDLMDTLIGLMKRDQESSSEFVLSLELMIGQVFGFFGAGFETSSNTLEFVLYELAKHPEVQEIARKNVLEVLQSHGDEFSFDNLKEMEYLQQVLQETMRLHPPAPYTVRVCRQTCVLKTKEHSLTIPIGTKVMIPIYGIHRNPDYYTQPERFIPERFATSSNEDILAKQLPTFMPFGAGPRICIGERFAKMVLILSLAMLLTRFRFSYCPETPMKLQFDPKKMLVLSSKSIIKLKVETL